jgi:hypothetical protein
VVNFFMRLYLAWRFWHDAKLHYSWRTSWILAEHRSPWLT